MTRITTRLHIFGAMAALAAVTSLAIPAVSAWAEAAEPTTLAADASDRPSFMFPESTYLQGLGWEIDTGGPAVRMEYLGED